MIGEVLEADWVRNPVWVKYECDNGNRWVALRNGIVHEPDGVPCNFAGCGEGCVAHIRGETKSAGEACEWFRNASWEKKHG